MFGNYPVLTSSIKDRPSTRNEKAKIVSNMITCFELRPLACYRSARKAAPQLLYTRRGKVGLTPMLLVANLVNTK